jgi:site-specific DNA recombinase
MNEVDHERMHDRPNMDVANRLSHYGWRLCSYEKGCQQSRRNQSGADEDAQGKRQNMSTKELRLVTYRICNDAVIYYTQDAAEYKKTAAELDTMLTCAEWMKWFGDQAFSYLMTTYYGNTADAILSPAKDLFAAFLGEVLDYLLHGESFTLEEPEIIKNIPVYFEKENINTLDTKGEILLTIMASLAQQESQSLSQNVKLGIQYRYQQGKIHINHNRFLGYTKDKDGNLVIVPEEAEIVKRIYREYLEGSSMLQIARGLEADGILTGAGNPRWHTSTINKILRNEKYIGDALLQKTYTVDFLSKKRVPNNGIVPQYYVENSHEPIIPREIFMQVQEQLVKRRCVHISKNGKKRNYSNNHPLSQMVFCGKCHEVFRRVHWNNRGKKSIVWRCVSRLENTGLFCTASTILEDTLKEKIVEAVNIAVSGKNSFLAILKKNIETVLNEDLDESTADIDKRLEELQAELIQLANSKEAYDNIVNEIYRLRDLRQETLSRNALRQDKRDRIAEMTDFLNMQTGGITEFDDKLVRKLIEKATVYNDRLVVEFKSGLEIEVNL